MQIVIDIPEEAYDFIKRTGYHTQSLYEAIKNGTPLPEKHSDLIDRQELIEVADECYEDGDFKAVSISEIKYAKAIIKATEE